MTNLVRTGAFTQWVYANEHQADTENDKGALGNHFGWGPLLF